MTPAAAHAKGLFSDALWDIVNPLLPRPATRAKGARPRVPDRAVLAGIVYVLRTGIPWNMLPAEFGCSGVTCWRRLGEWTRAGVWRRLLKVLRDRLGNCGGVDWSRAALDSASVPAKRGARRPAPTP